MRLSVEHVLVERDVLVRREQQIQVLERLGQEKALLHIILNRTIRSNVSEARVAFRSLAMFLDRLEDLPAPVAILLFASESPHIEQGLNRLGPHNVSTRITHGRVEGFSIDVNIDILGR